MTKRDIEVLAMQIVNTVNERTGVSVEVRQETNDANFDAVIDMLLPVIPDEEEEKALARFHKACEVDREILNHWCIKRGLITEDKIAASEEKAEFKPESKMPPHDAALWSY